MSGTVKLRGLGTIYVIYQDYTINRLDQ